MLILQTTAQGSMPIEDISGLAVPAKPPPAASDHDHEQGRRAIHRYR